MCLPVTLRWLHSGGPGSPNNPVAVRQHPNPAYQGLRVIPGHWANYPLIESFFARSVGVGVRHRGAAAVVQVTTQRELHATEQHAYPNLGKGFDMTVRWYPWGFDDKPGYTPSEFSHGRGLRPKKLLHAPPDDGGMYAAKAPPMPKERKGKQRYGFPGDKLRA